MAGQYTNVFLLYGESGSPPSEVQQTSSGLLTPLGSDELTPAKTRLLELAFDHDFRNGLVLTANLYTFLLENRIGTVPDDDAPIGTRFANLSNRERGSGVELQFAWRASRQLNISAGGALQQLATEDLVNAGAPRFQPYLEADFEGARWGWNVAAIGVLDRDREPGDDRAPIDDYTIVNLTAVRSDVWVDGLDLSVSVQNAFDENAREDVSSAVPADVPVYPRRLLVSLTYNK